MNKFCKDGDRAMNTQHTRDDGMSIDNGKTRKAKATFTAFAALLIALTGFSFVTSCNDKVVAFDDPPPAPQGVFTVRGDDTVFVFWLPVQASDFDHYNVYSALDSSNGTVFDLIGTSTDESFVDADVVNGTRYYYAITAVDIAGNESLESAEYGGATPRFQGTVTLLTNDVDTTGSGFDFATEATVPFNSPLADFWIDRDGSGILYINADSIADPNLGDVQDMGFTTSLDEIGRAPQDGWSALGYTELIEGHTYIIWTEDDRYAKVRVVIMGPSFARLDYAYQSGTDSFGNGEPELVSPNSGDNTDATASDRSTGAHRTDHNIRLKTPKVSAVQ